MKKNLIILLLIVSFMAVTLMGCAAESAQAATETPEEIPEPTPTTATEEPESTPEPTPEPEPEPVYEIILSDAPDDFKIDGDIFHAVTYEIEQDIEDPVLPGYTVYGYYDENGEEAFCAYGANFEYIVRESDGKKFSATEAEADSEGLYAVEITAEDGIVTITIIGDAPLDLTKPPFIEEDTTVANDGDSNSGTSGSGSNSGSSNSDGGGSSGGGNSGGGSNNPAPPNPDPAPAPAPAPTPAPDTGAIIGDHTHDGGPPPDAPDLDFDPIDLVQVG